MSVAFPTSRKISPWLVICGGLFTLLWIAAHLLWASMTLFGSLMANDAGTATSGQHAGLIFGMLGDQILAGSAGIPAGLAIFWCGKRRRLWTLFGVLLTVGALAQGWAFYRFVTAASAQ